MYEVTLPDYDKIAEFALEEYKWSKERLDTTIARLLKEMFENGKRLGYRTGYEEGYKEGFMGVEQMESDKKFIKNLASE